MRTRHAAVVKAHRAEAEPKDIGAFFTEADMAGSGPMPSALHLPAYLRAGGQVKM